VSCDDCNAAEMLAKGEVGGGGKCSVPFAMSDRYSNVAELPASSNKKKFRRICRGGTRTKLHRYAIRQLVKFQLANCSFFWFHWLNSHYQHTTLHPLKYPGRNTHKAAPLCNKAISKISAG